MNDIILEIHWSNNPIPLNELLKKPEIVFDIPLGLFTSLESPVKSVNGKIGSVVLNAEDIEADPIGSAQAVQNFIESIIQPQIESLSENKLDRVDYVQHHLGSFISKASLDAAHPVANEGDSADIDSGTGFDVMRAIWDANDHKWVIREVGNASNTDQIPEGNSNLYFKAERVLSSLLSGLNIDSDTAITFSDSILQAFGKIQGQFNNLAAKVRTTLLTGLVTTDSSNVSASDTVLVAIGKLQAKSQTSSGFDWIQASSINGFSLHTQVSQGSIPLKLAKKDGVLWLSGSLSISGSVLTTSKIFSLINAGYKIERFASPAVDIVVASINVIEMGYNFGTNPSMSPRVGSIYMTSNELYFKMPFNTPNDGSMIFLAQPQLEE